MATASATYSMTKVTLEMSVSEFKSLMVFMASKDNKDITADCDYSNVSNIRVSLDKLARECAADQ